MHSLTTWRRSAPECIHSPLGEGQLLNAFNIIWYYVAFATSKLKCIIIGPNKQSTNLFDLIQQPNWSVHIVYIGIIHQWNIINYRVNKPFGSCRYQRKCVCAIMAYSLGFVSISLYFYICIIGDYISWIKYCLSLTIGGVCACCLCKCGQVTYYSNLVVNIIW